MTMKSGYQTDRLCQDIQFFQASERKRSGLRRSTGTHLLQPIMVSSLPIMVFSLQNECKLLEAYSPANYTAIMLEHKLCFIWFHLI